MKKNIIELQEKLQTLLSAEKDNYLQGKVANYIPALAIVKPDLMGIAVGTLDGKVVGAGDYQHPFSIQSISKVFGLVMAINRIGDPLWKRVRMEPSGLPFNSIIQLQAEKGIPRNPVINAGAILISDILTSNFSSSKFAFLTYIRKLARNDNIRIDNDVYLSEVKHGHLNAYQMF